MLARKTMFIRNKWLPRRGPFCSLFVLSGDDKANEHCRGCHQRHDEPGGRLATNPQLARMQIDRRTELAMAAETALSEGGTEQFDFGNRSLLGGEGHVAEGGREHFRMGAKFHALIHAVVASIVVAIKGVSVIIFVMIAIVVVGAGIVVQIVSLAGLALLEDIEGVVPGLQQFLKGSGIIVASTVVVIVVVVAFAFVVAIKMATVVVNAEIPYKVDGIHYSGIFGRTSCVGVETERHTALGKGLHVVVYGVPIFVGLVRLGAAAGPGIAIGLHETVLCFGPDADTLVLVELFHPLAIIRLLEETEQLEVGIAEMTIVLGAAAALGDAGGRVPRAGVAVEELILANALPSVVEVDVL